MEWLCPKEAFVKALPIDLTRGPEVAPPEVFRLCRWLIPKLLASICAFPFPYSAGVATFALFGNIEVLMSRTLVL